MDFSAENTLKSEKIGNKYKIPLRKTCLNYLN